MQSMHATCYQVNLQNWYGGGEVYTSFFARALENLGVRTVLFAHREAGHWLEHMPASARIIAIDPATLAQRLASLRDAWTAFHSVAGAEAVVALHGAGSAATAFIHMPWYERDPAALAPYDLVIPVSQHVAESVRAHGIGNVYPEPLYGVADLHGPRGSGSAELNAETPYDWDRRKFRDRVLSVLHPPWLRLRRPARFARLPGVTLGIVSGITPIKQFPLLFQVIAPLLAGFPMFRLEIFGSGGYASVRDLRTALKPIGDRVRFWGRQRNVRAAYAQIDYLLTGLPEKEALGLNVIEAQTCNVPVLAIDAPPFTETVAPEVTGILYPDPRADGGRGFAEMLARLARTPFTVDRVRAVEHMRRFSQEAFVARVGRLVAEVRRRGWGKDPQHFEDGR